MLFYNVVKTLVRTILSLVYRIEVIGIENIPRDGKAIVCANHFNLLDPIFIGTILPRKINFMAKEELFSNRLFASILNKLGVFPVKRGEVDISAIKTSLRILKNGEIFGIFPEGTRSKTGEVLDAKPGLAMIGIKSQSPIIPIAIIGNYKMFSKVKIIIDNPVELSSYYNQKLSTEEYQKLSQGILENIKGLINKEKLSSRNPNIGPTND